MIPVVLEVIFPLELPQSSKADYKLNFDEHVKILCSKANNKMKALSRAMPYMSVEKKISMNSFFNAQFNYCPLI